jgi:ABC-type microcin C transport system permease subunit YejE
MVLLGVFQIQIDESIWQAVPVLYLISTIFFVVGANNFIQPVKSRNPKKPKKK